VSGIPPTGSIREGTAVKKTYQEPAASASADVVVPEQVTIGFSEIVASAKEGLLASPSVPVCR
jgi:hypothetical protein